MQTIDFDYQRITADFYSLKHSFLDLLDGINTSDISVAQQMASHRSDKITGIYAVGRARRKNEFLKTIQV